MWRQDVERAFRKVLLRLGDVSDHGETKQRAREQAHLPSASRPSSSTVTARRGFRCFGRRASALSSNGRIVAAVVCNFLLRGAVNTAASGSNAINVDSHDLAVRIHGREDVTGISVRLRIAKLGHDHAAVHEVVVDIPRCKVLVVLILLPALVGPGRGKRGHIERAALCVRGVLQNVQMGEGHVVVVALWVGIVRCNNDAGADEACIEVGVSDVSRR